jgi:hypothetical protein
MKSETKRIKEYRSDRIKQGKAYAFTVLINDEELAKFAKNEIKNKSEFLKQAIESLRNKKRMA